LATYFVTERASCTNLSHASHYTELLCRYKTLQHDTQGHIDIVFINIITKMHSCVCLWHANNRFDVTYSDWYTSCCLEAIEVNIISIKPSFNYKLYMLICDNSKWFVLNKNTYLATKCSSEYIKRRYFFSRHTKRQINTKTQINNCCWNTNKCSILD